MCQKHADRMALKEQSYLGLHSLPRHSCPNTIRIRSMKYEYQPYAETVDSGTESGDFGSARSIRFASKVGKSRRLRKIAVFYDVNSRRS